MKKFFAMMLMVGMAILLACPALATTATVASEAEFEAALSDATVDTIALGANFDLTKNLSINRNITIKCFNYELGGADYALTANSGLQLSSRDAGGISAKLVIAGGELSVEVASAFTVKGSVQVNANGSIGMNVGKFTGPVTNEGTIENGTFDGTVTNSGTMKTGTFDGAVTNSGTIENGTFDGTVTNSGTIKRGVFSATVTNSGTIETGTFDGTVTNEANGTVADGTFNKKVTNSGTIEGGVFNAEVTNEETGTIKNSTSNEAILRGTFNRKVTNSGTIETGTFHGSVTNNATGTISGGIFMAVVTNSGIIKRGSFYAPVNNESSGTIEAGTFRTTIGGNALDNSGTIKGGVFDGTVANTSGGKIESGMWNGTVRNENGATISGGGFSNDVMNRGNIQGGLFNCKVDNSGTITGGDFQNTYYGVNNEVAGVIDAPMDDPNQKFVKIENNGGTIKKAYLVGELQNNSGIIEDGVFENVSGMCNLGTIQGGQFEGNMDNSGTITYSTAANGDMIVPVFRFGRVTNRGTIKAANFGEDARVTNETRIDGATVKGESLVRMTGPNCTVLNEGYIEGGVLFENDSALENLEGGCVAGGRFEENTSVKNNGHISGGTFYGEITNEGTIQKGTEVPVFESTSYLKENGVIFDGFFYGRVEMMAAHIEYPGSDALIDVKLEPGDGAVYSGATKLRILKGQTIANNCGEDQTPVSPYYYSNDLVFGGWNKKGSSSAWDFTQTRILEPVTLEAQWIGPTRIASTAQLKDALNRGESYLMVVTTFELEKDVAIPAGMQVTINAIQGQGIISNEQKRLIVSEGATLDAAGGVHCNILNKGTLRSGRFGTEGRYGTIHNEGMIENGEYYFAVYNDQGGVIAGGYFYGPVENGVGGTILEPAYAVITLDTDGGSKMEPIKVLPGQTATQPEAPVKAGYTFAGWMLGDEEYTFTDRVMDDMTLKAQWVVLPKTGDSTNLMLWIGLTALSMGGAFVLRKRKHTELN